MIKTLRADLTTSVSSLKKNPMAIITEAAGRAVAVLNRNTPAFYCVPPELYETMIDALEDKELQQVVESRAGEEPVRISLADL